MLVQRAVAAGARALIFTVETTNVAPSHPLINPRSWPGLPRNARITNLTPDDLAKAGPEGVVWSPDLTFEAIGWLREISGLPVLVKGWLRADDAIGCIDAGAVGVIVSTHGGRRLGASISTVRALTEIVAAVGNRAEVYADSGIRTGEHVAAALALGARAVFVGRPALWALAADGEQGVAMVLSHLHRELEQVMVQLGTADLAASTDDLIAR